jgi:septum formation protein
MNRRLILASRSPRRKALLEALRLDIKAVPSGVVESFREGESPKDHVLRLATEKAEWVAKRFPERWVIGADTTVVIEGRALGKPGDASEATAMLSLLSGRDHWVLTGYTITRKKGSTLVSRVVETRVKVKDLSAEEITWYIRTGEPFDKAGAYAIQGVGCFMVVGIEGSYTNVVGLPVCQVLESLRALGAVELK